jgi:hypothetical protein
MDNALSVVGLWIMDLGKGGMTLETYEDWKLVHGLGTREKLCLKII